MKNKFGQKGSLEAHEIIQLLKWVNFHGEILSEPPGNFLSGGPKKKSSLPDPWDSMRELENEPVKSAV